MSDNLLKIAPTLLPVTLLPHAVGLPAYATAGAAGMDLAAAIDEPLVIPGGEWRLVPTGIAVAVPVGFEIQIRPRSGLSLKQGLTVLNAPGTIDSDYRGEVGVILYNASAEPRTVSRGDRIAQAVLAPVARVEWVPVDALPETARGAGGFGSTGRSS